MHHDIFNILNMSTSPYIQYSKLIASLANPKRIEILRLLTDQCVTVSELIRMTGINQSNLSQHMQILRREGVVVTKREGKEIVYCLSHEKFISVLESIHDILVDRKLIKYGRTHVHLPKTPTITDPVCGMKVSPKHAVFSSSYKRTTFYFCASGCQKKFTLHPEEYAEKD